MKKIKITFTNVILLCILMFGCLKFTPFIKIGNNYINKSIKIYGLKEDFKAVSIKLDSIVYEPVYSGYGGDAESLIIIYGKHSDGFLKLHESPDGLVSEIENNGYSIQKVWYNRNYKKVFLKTEHQDKFPWVTILIKNIIAIIISISTPLIIAFYLIKNAIKLIFLIYKKEYYNVENTEDK